MQANPQSAAASTPSASVSVTPPQFQVRIPDNSHGHDQGLGPEHMTSQWSVPAPASAGSDMMTMDDCYGGGYGHGGYGYGGFETMGMSGMDIDQDNPPIGVVEKVVYTQSPAAILAAQQQHANFQQYRPRILARSVTTATGPVPVSGSGFLNPNQIEQNMNPSQQQGQGFIPQQQETNFPVPMPVAATVVNTNVNVNPIQSSQIPPTLATTPVILVANPSGGSSPTLVATAAAATVITPTTITKKIFVPAGTGAQLLNSAAAATATAIQPICGVNVVQLLGGSKSIIPSCQSASTNSVKINSAAAASTTTHVTKILPPPVGNQVSSVVAIPAPAPATMAIPNNPSSGHGHITADLQNSVAAAEFEQRPMSQGQISLEEGNFDINKMDTNNSHNNSATKTIVNAEPDRHTPHLNSAGIPNEISKEQTQEISELQENYPQMMIPTKDKFIEPLVQPDRTSKEEMVPTMIQMEKECKAVNVNSETPMAEPLQSNKPIETESSYGLSNKNDESMTKSESKASAAPAVAKFDGTVEKFQPPPPPPKDEGDNNLNQPRKIVKAKRLKQDTKKQCDGTKPKRVSLGSKKGQRSFRERDLSPDSEKEKGFGSEMKSRDVLMASEKMTEAVVKLLGGKRQLILEGVEGRTPASNRSDSNFNNSNESSRDMTDVEKPVLCWEDGVGALPGSDLKFRVNELGVFELIEPGSSGNSSSYGYHEREPPVLHKEETIEQSSFKKEIGESKPPRQRPAKKKPRDRKAEKEKRDLRKAMEAEAAANAEQSQSKIPQGNNDGVENGNGSENGLGGIDSGHGSENEFGNDQGQGGSASASASGSENGRQSKNSKPSPKRKASVDNNPRKKSFAAREKSPTPSPEASESPTPSTSTSRRSSIVDNPPEQGQQPRSKKLKLKSPIRLTRNSLKEKKDRKRSFERVLSSRMPHLKQGESPGRTESESDSSTQGDVVEHNWEKYLTETKSKAAPLKLFRQPALPDANPFKKGMMLEAIDPQHPNLFCVGCVVETQGYRLRIRLVGFCESYDFWVNADSDEIFPCGWCEENGQELQPPPNEEHFSWHQFLVEKRSPAADRHFFVISREDPLAEASVRVGMKLEASDIRNQKKICVATVGGVIGDRFLVHFDEWDSAYDYWTDLTSPYIHPVGWCEREGEQLVPPPTSKPGKSPFSWEKYLKETKSMAMPTRLFQPLPPVQFKVGMKLECVDKRNPFLIRVATITSVQNHELGIHFDGWSEIYDYDVYELSPDIHPVGWCAHTGHPLQPPPDGSKDWTGPCPQFGCLGLGHIKGPKFLTHNTEKNCPYAIHNYQKDWPQRTDRLVALEKGLGLMETSRAGSEEKVIRKKGPKTKKGAVTEVKEKDEPQPVTKSTSSSPATTPLKRPRSPAQQQDPPIPPPPQMSLPTQFPLPPIPSSSSSMGKVDEIVDHSPPHKKYRRRAVKSQPPNPSVLPPLTHAPMYALVSTQAQAPLLPVEAQAKPEKKSTKKLKTLIRKRRDKSRLSQEVSELSESLNKTTLESQDVDPIIRSKNKNMVKAKFQENPLAPPRFLLNPHQFSSSPIRPFVRQPELFNFTSPGLNEQQQQHLKAMAMAAQNQAPTPTPPKMFSGETYKAPPPPPPVPAGSLIQSPLSMNLGDQEIDLPVNLGVHILPLREIVGDLSADDVSHWQTAEVKKFVARIPGCTAVANRFSEQMIDGDSFLMLNQGDLTEVMGFKMGPVIKLAHTIRLIHTNPPRMRQRRKFQQKYDEQGWAI